MSLEAISGHERPLEAISVPRPPRARAAQGRDRRNSDHGSRRAARRDTRRGTPRAPDEGCNQHALRDAISMDSEILLEHRDEGCNQHALRDAISTPSEILLEHRERRDVEVICRLIEYENVRARSEAREQLEPAALATAQLRHIILPTAGRKGKLREQLPRDIHTNGRASSSPRHDPRRDLMREAIKGAIKGHPRPSEVISGQIELQLPQSVVISGTHRQSVVISGTQRQSVVIGGTHRQSVVISGTAATAASPNSSSSLTASPPSPRFSSTPSLTCRGSNRRNQTQSDAIGRNQTQSRERSAVIRRNQLKLGNQRQSALLIDANQATCETT